MTMDARLRFTMQEGDLQLVDESLEKANPYKDGATGRFTTGGGGSAMRTDGANSLHRQMQPKIDAITEKIDALPKEPKIAADIAQAKVSIDSAAKSPTASGSAVSLLGAHTALDRAAQRVVGSQTPLAFRIKDIRQDVKFLAEALQRP
jgi:hypothetical protein